MKEVVPTLFLTIVAIGTRFWHQNDKDFYFVSPLGVHKRYPEIIRLLDLTFSRLLLRPSATDASLETIQSLLLYLQWMPYDSTLISPGSSNSYATHKTRYNETSAWTVFGLALRYASFYGLESKASRSFNDDSTVSKATKEDLDCMRVWLNMVTYDCNLTLTSGLPASLDPGPVSTMAWRYCAHHAAQQPGDVRYASMIQLACIIQDVRCEKNNIAERNQVISVVSRANEEFDAWQRYA